MPKFIFVFDETSRSELDCVVEIFRFEATAQGWFKVFTGAPSIPIGGYEFAPVDYYSDIEYDGRWDWCEIQYTGTSVQATRFVHEYEGKIHRSGRITVDEAVEWPDGSTWAEQATRLTNALHALLENMPAPTLSQTRALYSSQPYPLMSSTSGVINPPPQDQYSATAYPDETPYSRGELQPATWQLINKSGITEVIALANAKIAALNYKETITRDIVQYGSVLASLCTPDGYGYIRTDGMTGDDRAAARANPSIVYLRPVRRSNAQVIGELHESGQCTYTARLRDANNAVVQEITATVLIDKREGEETWGSGPIVFPAVPGCRWIIERIEANEALRQIAHP